MVIPQINIGITDWRINMLDAIRSSSEIVENNLIKMILSGEYSPGNTLPSERELAKNLGVGRPTLREAMQRLKRDGWISVKKGQTAVVNNYWKSGNLNTLVNIVRSNQQIPNDFIIYLLELRLVLAPAFVKDAVIKYPAKVVALLSNLELLENNSYSYASFDWQLQKELAELASNPLFLLILNSFDDVYINLANKYFSKEENRLSSLSFYKALLSSAMKQDAFLSERVTIEAMTKSIELWKLSEGV